MKLDNETLKTLKGIGHYLKPVVSLGNNGLSQNVRDELDRALTDHELIKVRLPAGSKEERTALANELVESVNAHLIHSIGRMILILRQNPNPNPKLSNLLRYSL